MVTYLSQCLLGDRCPTPLKEGKHSTATGKCWWNEVRAITDVAHIGKKNIRKNYRTVWPHPHEFCCENSAYKFMGNRRKDKQHPVIFKQK